MNTFELQTWLKELGFSPGTVDGLWGKKTLAAAKELLNTHGVAALPKKGSYAIAVEQLVMKIVGGLAVGPIDGIAGVITEKARKHWLNGNWRGKLDLAQPGDERFPAPVNNTWPLESQMEKFYGAPGTNQVMLDLPFPMVLAWDQHTTIGRFSINKKVQASALRVYESVLKHYGYDEIKRLRLDQFGGCLNVRNKRGGKTLSTHAYGIAIDTDPTRNPLRGNSKNSPLAGPLYKAWWDAWTAEGWLSLGKARDYDWMHVQAARLG